MVEVDRWWGWCGWKFTAHSRWCVFSFSLSSTTLQRFITTFELFCIKFAFSHAKSLHIAVSHINFKWHLCNLLADFYFSLSFNLQHYTKQKNGFHAITGRRNASIVGNNYNHQSDRLRHSRFAKRMDCVGSKPSPKSIKTILQWQCSDNEYFKQKQEPVTTQILFSATGRIGRHTRRTLSLGFADGAILKLANHFCGVIIQQA